MKITKGAERSKKKNEEINNVLKQKLEDVEKYKFLENTEKGLFMEGAQWMSNKIG